MREHLAEYGDISPDQLRQAFHRFPRARSCRWPKKLGVRLCCHPDDPPFSLLGLPRIMSTAADYAQILDAVDSPANGMTLCSGSLGARPDNDLPAMMRAVRAEGAFPPPAQRQARQRRDIAGSFFEAEHLGGDTDMVALIAAIVEEERAAQARGPRRLRRSRCGPTTGRTSSTISSAARSRAIRRSAGSRAWRSCAGVMTRARAQPIRAPLMAPDPLRA